MVSPRSLLTNSTELDSAAEGWRKPTRLPGCDRIRLSLSKFLIDQHAQEIARDHNQFKQTLSLPWEGRWVGTLTPAFQEYEVAISFVPGAADDQFQYVGLPISVTVLAPKLTGRLGPPAQLIPHLYRYPTDVLPPRLCLYWPHDREWTVFESISQYIIPWTAEWLLNYELWKITGTWASPEAPHDVVPDEPIAKAQADQSEQGERPLAVALSRVTNGAHLRDETALANNPYFVLNAGI